MRPELEAGEEAIAWTGPGMVTLGEPFPSLAKPIPSV